MEVVVRWGDYRRVEAEGDGLEENRREVAREAETAGEQPGEDNDESGGDARRPGQGAGDEPGADDRSARSWWQRIPREEPVAVALPTMPENPRPYPVPNSGGLAIHVVARPVNAASFAGRTAPGARSLSLFLVNNRTAASHQEREVSFAFQAEIEVRSATPFVPRPDPREVSGEDRDERVADLHYAHTPEYAAGHGVSADWELVDGACRVLRTTWTPAADVEKTETFDVPGAELDMRVPGALADGFAAEAALSPLATEYRSWIEDRRAGLGALSGDRLEAAGEILHLAEVAAARMEHGIRALADYPDALDAFRTANRAVYASNALAAPRSRRGMVARTPPAAGSASSRTTRAAGRQPFRSRAARGAARISPRIPSPCSRIRFGRSISASPARTGSASFRRPGSAESRWARGWTS
ncbi:MAG: hypothetical protein OXC01_19710 [Immundisolibacterales bacterium]|nr:hypothetical protein [Immundisolibacterales bacterium]